MKDPYMSNVKSVDQWSIVKIEENGFGLNRGQMTPIIIIIIMGSIFTVKGNIQDVTNVTGTITKT